ncbi:MAG TPA: TauD/TfdA family dioxygenase [Labilithrix sp.]|nr:TauD/TfdA family dioxygenase [Labilithrix sp.]
MNGPTTELEATTRTSAPSWKDITTRTLRRSERPYACGEPTLPVVVEAERHRSVKWLATRLSAEPAAIKAMLHTHGAVLFRGFDVTRDADFEELVTSVDRARPMTSYFMSEAGRHSIEGTRGVLNTNSLYKTGGALYLGGFHSENFYSTDVPALQAFWCKEPPQLGGETAIVHSANMYAELPRELRHELEKERVLAGVFSVKSIAERYGVDEARVEAFCRAVGLEVHDGVDGKAVLVFKPVVIEHPQTGRPALQVNVSGEVPGFDAALRRHAAPSYRGLRWALHRAAWQSPSLAALLPLVDSYPLLVETLSGTLGALAQRLRARRESTPSPLPGRLGERLTASDAEALARAVWRHTSVFTWQRGDVLLCDQLQLLHAGMPGRGRRDIRVMMCDPIRIELPVTSGVLSPRVDRSYEPIGARLARLA